MTNPRDWYYLDEKYGTTCRRGPYSDSELIALAKAGILEPSTKVSSETRTKNRQVPVSAIPKLMRRLAPTITVERTANHKSQVKSGKSPEFTVSNHTEPLGEWEPVNYSPRDSNPSEVNLTLKNSSMNEVLQEAYNTTKQSGKKGTTVSYPCDWYQVLDFDQRPSGPYTDWELTELAQEDYLKPETLLFSKSRTDKRPVPVRAIPKLNNYIIPKKTGNTIDEHCNELRRAASVVSETMKIEYMDKLRESRGMSLFDRTLLSLSRTEDSDEVDDFEILDGKTKQAPADFKISRNDILSEASMATVVEQSSSVRNFPLTPQEIAGVVGVLACLVILFFFPAFICVVVPGAVFIYMIFYMIFVISKL